MLRINILLQRMISLKKESYHVSPECCSATHERVSAVGPCAFRPPNEAHHASIRCIMNP